MYAGVFCISPKNTEADEVNRQESSLTRNFAKTRSMAASEKEDPLRIIIFLCKSESDQFDLHKSGAIVSLKNLIWSYPKQDKIHIVNIEEMLKIKVEREP